MWHVAQRQSCEAPGYLSPLINIEQIHQDAGLYCGKLQMRVSHVYRATKVDLSYIPAKTAVEGGRANAGKFQGLSSSSVFRRISFRRGGLCPGPGQSAGSREERSICHRIRNQCAFPGSL